MSSERMPDAVKEACEIPLLICMPGILAPLPLGCAVLASQ